jgi:hypothetical protein
MDTKKERVRTKILIVVVILVVTFKIREFETLNFSLAPPGAFDIKVYQTFS